MLIPQEFVDSTVVREGEAGRAWIAELPDIVSRLCGRWNLVTEGPVFYGYLAIVLPVLRSNDRLVLKVSWMDEYSAQEALALRLWDGRGAVRLFDEDPASGAMLLERLDPALTLEHIPEREATVTAAKLLRRLAIGAPKEVRTVGDEVLTMTRALPELWEKTGRPFTRKLLDRLLELLDELGQRDAGLMVNSDLHYANVLRGEREPWLVIDPKILAGDVEYGVAPLLWNRFDELETQTDFERRLSCVVETAELDLRRARLWTIVRTAESWLWALSLGFTEDPKKCRRLLEWLGVGITD